MAFFTSEDLFNAIKTIVDKSISKVSYDKTIVCTIEDNSKASEGEYKVSNNGQSFTAYSEKTNYTLGASVYVIIPQGNYENKKLIVGKYLGDDGTPYTYIPPTENYVNMTGNIIDTSPSFSLLINKNDRPKTDSLKLTDLNLIGYNRLGVKADFQTLIAANTVIAGHYGLAFKISGIRNDGIDEDELIFFDSDDMFGNPYNFIGATTQEKVFDISSYSEINSIEVYLYQNSDFIDSQGQKIKHQTSIIVSDLPDNLLASNLEISAGYDYSLFDKETILLYTLNSKIFSAEDSVRNLQARFITLNSDTGTYTQMANIPYMSEQGIVIPNNYSDNFPEDTYDYDSFIEQQMNNDYIVALKEKISALQAEMDATVEAAEEDVNIVSQIIDNYNKQIDEIQDEVDELVAASTYEGRYLIHWYQWDMAPEVKDDLAGAFWKEIYPSSSYECAVELRGAAKAHERFKIIIEEIIGANEETFQKNYYESEVLEFTNENGSVETNLAVDLVSSLTLSTSDDYNGIYAIYGSDGKLMNQTDAMKDRYIVVSYQSLVTGLTEFDGAESITWQVPGNNTMIIVPTDQDGLDITQDEQTKVITVSGKIDTSENDTDIIGENNIRGAKLRFRINPVYSQINTNNTVKCLITRQGFQYAAQMTMRFAPAGTNGTDYTLVLEIDNNQQYMAIPLENNSNFPGLRVIAQLQDYENKPIDGKISLAFEDDAGLMFESGDSVISINSGETAIISRNSNPPSGYGMVVATTYVWVSNKVAEDTEDTTAIANQRQIMLTAYLPLSYSTSGYSMDLIEGPVRVIYDGGGSNPVYTKLPYNLYSGGILRTDAISWIVKCQNEGDARYIGSIVDGLYTPPIMLIKNLGPVYIEGYIGETKIWSQRILLSVNRFGSSMLNRWDGSLTIDEENNQILSSIIGAGSKNSDNSFTGVIMGDIGKDVNSAKTGLYGYNAGQQAFSFLADGTATIGQAGKGALKFDGNKGTINANNYLKDETGMLLDFDDAQLLTKLVKIRGQAKGTASILEIDGFETDNNDNELNNTVHQLMRVGNGKYFLQSANFSENELSGFQLNLGRNKITGFSTELNFYNVGEKKYLPSGKIIKNNNTITITTLSNSNNSYENCYISEDLVLDANNKFNGTNEDFEGLQNIDWCYIDDIKTAPSIGDYESLLTIDSGAKEYPLWIESSKNKTFKLGWDGSMQTTSGMIGNWIINSNSLTTNGGKIGMASWTKSGGPIFWSGAKALELSSGDETWTDKVGFGVDSNGNMYANTGNIGSWQILDGKLIGGDISYKEGETTVNAKITLSSDGTINAKTVTATLNGSAIYAINSGLLSGFDYKSFAFSDHTHSMTGTIPKGTQFEFENQGIYKLQKNITVNIGTSGSSSGGNGGCLAPGTKIIMANGSIKNIEDIKVGDLVIAYDEIYNQFIPKKVIKSYPHFNTPKLIEIKFNNGNKLLITPGHPIYTIEGWKSRDLQNSLYEHNTVASLLNINDYAIGFNNQQNQIISIKELYIPKDYTSFNIEVEDCHTFVANNIVVHNAKSEQPFYPIPV